MANIQRVDHGTHTVLRLVGDFGREAAPATRLRDEMVLLPAPPRVVLDVGDMTHWDEGTIGALIASLKRAMSAGGRLVIAGASPDLRERFRSQALPFEQYATGTVGLPSKLLIRLGFTAQYRGPRSSFGCGMIATCGLGQFWREGRPYS